MTKDEVPGCCGELMFPLLRYKEHRYTYCEFVCAHCRRHQDVEWSPGNHKECVR